MSVQSSVNDLPLSILDLLSSILVTSWSSFIALGSCDSRRQPCHGAG
jgi:hypothetical protein